MNTILIVWILSMTVCGTFTLVLPTLDTVRKRRQAEPDRRRTAREVARSTANVVSQPTQ